jgi:hypothetical protein
MFILHKKAYEKVKNLDINAPPQLLSTHYKLNTEGFQPSQNIIAKPWVYNAM